MPRVPERRGTKDGVSAVVIVRAPQLLDCLRAFCLGSFRALLSELERGADLPFAFEEHSSYDRPALYEYRPLVKPFIESRAHTLRRRPDAELAVDELRREPAAAIFARAHAGPRADEHEALFGSVLLPLLISTAEMCGGFDWDDSAYERAYAELEAALFGKGHKYGAIAPLIGITTGGATIELGGGMRVRLAATGELAKLWPEANGLLPTDFGHEADRLSILELERSLEPGATEPPDAPGSLPTRSPRFVSRPRRRSPQARCSSSASTGVPTESVPCCRSRRHSPPANRHVSTLSARVSRPICYRASRSRTTTPSSARRSTAGSCRCSRTARSRREQLRESLAALLGGSDGLWAAAVRGAILLGDTPRARAELQDRLAGDPEADVIRRALVETLMQGDRAQLVASLDESILGLRAPPPSYFAARAAAG